MVATKIGRVRRADERMGACLSGESPVGQVMADLQVAVWEEAYRNAPVTSHAVVRLQRSALSAPCD